MSYRPIIINNPSTVIEKTVYLQQREMPRDVSATPRAEPRSVIISLPPPPLQAAEKKILQNVAVSKSDSTLPIDYLEFTPPPSPVPSARHISSSSPRTFPKPVVQGSPHVSPRVSPRDAPRAIGSSNLLTGRSDPPRRSLPPNISPIVSPRVTTRSPKLPTLAKRIYSIPKMRLWSWQLGDKECVQSGVMKLAGTIKIVIYFYSPDVQAVSQIKLACVNVITGEKYQEELNVTPSSKVSTCSATLNMTEGHYVFNLSSESKLCILSSITLEQL